MNEADMDATTERRLVDVPEQDAEVQKRMNGLVLRYIHTSDDPEARAALNLSPVDLFRLKVLTSCRKDYHTSVVMTIRREHHIGCALSNDLITQLQMIYAETVTMNEYFQQAYVVFQACHQREMTLISRQEYDEQAFNNAREQTMGAHLQYESTYIQLSIRLSKFEDLKRRLMETGNHLTTLKKKAEDLNFFNGGLNCDRANDAKTYNAKEDYETVAMQITGGIDKPLSEVLSNNNKTAQLGNYLVNSNANKNREFPVKNFDGKWESQIDYLAKCHEALLVVEI